MLTVDFSENYSFVLQDAAQGFHWNNSQATLHPFVAYYLDSGEIHHVSYVVISDCFHHALEKSRHFLMQDTFRKHTVNFKYTVVMTHTVHMMCHV